MYLFLPFINYGINLLKQSTFRFLIVFYILFFSIYYIIGALFTKQSYSFLIDGFSSSWLTILYIIGSYFGKYILESSNKTKILHIFYYFINYIGFSLLSSELFFITNKRVLICYLSPTILFQAFCLVMVFHSININNKYIIKILKFIAPLTFSVTLIHYNLITLNVKIASYLFSFIRGFKNGFLFFKIYIISLIIFIFCIALDYFRLLLFKFLKIKELCEFIENFFPKALNKLFIFIKKYYYL